MKSTRKSGKPVAAETIARMADQGKDVTGFFQGRGRMVQPIQRVNVDLTAGMLEELDRAAQDLNVSRRPSLRHWCVKASINTIWRNAGGSLRRKHALVRAAGINFGLSGAVPAPQSSFRRAALVPIGAALEIAGDGEDGVFGKCRANYL